MWAGREKKKTLISATTLQQSSRLNGCGVIKSLLLWTSSGGAMQPLQSDVGAE